MTTADPHVIGLRDADCVFCRIVSGDIPAGLLADTERVVAFRDIDPKADVHLLVVPKVHHVDVVDLASHDPGTLAEMVSVGARIAADVAPQGHFRLVFNTGALAGQSVFHVHGHVLAGSGVGMSL